MSTKKTDNSRGYTIRSNAKESDDVSKVLADIQHKMNSSPALNGGFDTLIYKVDKIEESQGKLVATVDKIHDAIYEPDNGLFSRIASVQSTATSENLELEKRLIEINSWKNQTEKSQVEEKKSDDALLKKVDELQKSFEQIVHWKTNVSKFMSWAAGGFGIAMITLVFKILYDVIVAHWK